MKIGILSLTLSFFSLLSFAQKQGNIWYFGIHAGLDFNTSPPTPLLNGQTDFAAPAFQWNEGYSTISDSAGNLLFYTDGKTVWNKYQNVMPAGYNLFGHTSSAQSSVIVPLPGSNKLYYVFTTDAVENNFQNGLRYSIVDMCLENGTGDVTLKNLPLLDSVDEKLICVRHTNQTDYWIITHKLNTGDFYSLLLTNTGIVDTVVSPTSIPDPVGWGSQMVASPNGEKIVYGSPTLLISSKNFLVDFNASTGSISNVQILSEGNRVWGLSFSPDNSKLYCSNSMNELYQYNLNAGGLTDIIASKTFIMQAVGLVSDRWKHHQLAPDGKIYLARVNKPFLSCIENPNEFYPACNFIDSAVYLGGPISSWGLPNFITAYKYHNQMSCTEYVPIEPPDTSNKELIFPNVFSPNADDINDTFSIENLPADATVHIYNRWGALVAEWNKPDGSWDGHTKSGTEVSEGIYYYIITLPDNERKKGFVQVIR